MKNIFKSLVLVAVAAMTFIACNKEVVPQQAQNVEGLYKYSFAIIEDATKAEIGENNVEWVNGDQVGMFVGSFKGAADVDVTTSPKTVSFMSASPIVAGTMAYAYFPYDQENDSATPNMVKIVVKGHQKGSSESVMPLAGIPFAVENNATNGAIKFLNLGSVINFKFYTTNSVNQDEVISSIKFNTSDGSAIAGIGYIDLTSVNVSSESSLELDMDAEVSSVTVEQEVELANNKDNAYPISMVVLPGTFAGTLTVTTDKATYTKAIPEREFARSASRTFSIDLANATREELQGSSFVKVKSNADLTDGDYLIVYEDDNVAFNGGLSTLDAASNTIDVTIDNDTIEGNETTDAAIFTININDGSIKSASGYYIGATSDANSLASNKSTVYNNTISLDDSYNAQIVSDKGPVLRYNATSGQDRFRFFKSSSYTSQKAIQLYKKSGGSSTSTTWVLTGIEVTTPPQKTEYNEGEFFSRAGMVVSAIYTDAEDPTHTKSEELDNSQYTVTPTTALTPDVEFVTITYNNKTTTYGITVNNVYVTLDWKYPSEGDSATSAGLSEIPGVIVNGLGSDYTSHAPYCIKLDDTGDFIRVKTDSAIGELSVSYKMIGGANTSSLDILESADGQEFSSVQNLTISGSQNSTGIVTTTNVFKASSRYIKISFNKGSNIGVGGITITKVDTTPRFTVESPLNATIAENTYNVSVTRKYFDGAITVSVPSECSWITATNVAANTNTFSVSLAANTGAARSATLTLSGEGVTAQSLVVNQEGNEPGTADNPYTVAQALEVAGALAENATTSSDVYVSGIVSTVSSFSSKYSSITYYISADGTASGELEVYSGKGLNGAAFSDITDLAVGDEVTVKGKLKNYGGTLEFDMNSQIVEITYATRYTVTLGSVSNGTIEASATSVGAQGIVTLTATPDTGYELDKWTVTNASTSAAITVDSEGKFTMPASNVTVSATFKEQQGGSPITITKTMAEIASANNWTTAAGNGAQTCYTSFNLDGIISVSTSGSANCGSFWGSDWRLYQAQNGDITIAASSGYIISKLTISYIVSNNGTLKSGNTIISSGSEQTIDASSVTYTVGNTGNKTNGQVRVTQISVTYTK